MDLLLLLQKLQDQWHFDKCINKYNTEELHRRPAVLAGWNNNRSNDPGPQTTTDTCAVQFKQVPSPTRHVSIHGPCNVVAYSLGTNDQNDCGAFSLQDCCITTLYSTLLPIASGIRNNHKLTETNRTNPVIVVLRGSCEDTTVVVSLAMRSLFRYPKTSTVVFRMNRMCGFLDFVGLLRSISFSRRKLPIARV